MRVFIGIDIDEELKKEIDQLQQQLHSTKGKWKDKSNLHITLKYLGEVDSIQMDEIDGVMKKICYNRKSFKLKLGDLGIFPGNNDIRVLWLGVTGDLENLHELYKDIDKEMLGIGFSLEKRGYTPHITIGQNVVYGGELVSHLKGEILVEKVYLFKSHRVEGRLTYTKIKEYPLH